ncbi:MAG: hypothetical protein ABGY11_12920 [Candidatus Thioglobus sp.]
MELDYTTPRKNFIDFVKKSNIVTELFNKLTCKNRLNNGTWRLLIVSSIPFTLFFILPGVLFWIVVHLALWVSDGYKDSGRDRIAEREIKKKTSINNFDDDAPF